MKTKFLFLVMLFATLLYLGCEKDDPQPDFPSQLEHRQFTSDALMGNPAGNATVRSLTVYTPNGYDDRGEKDYPVIYLLHGLPFGDDAYTSKEAWDPWITENGPFTVYPDFPEEGFKAWVDNLIQTGVIDPLIIVMADAESKPYGFSMYTNSALNGNYEDFIVEDLVNYIDANFKTITSKEGRAVIGHSQGGYGAIKLGLKHADKFSVVAAHSAPLVFAAFQAAIPGILTENPDGMTGPDPTKFLTSSIYAFSAAWSPNLNNPPFLVDLPFEYPSGNIIEATWARWLENDPFTLLITYEANLKILTGVYFDVGDKDQFGFGAAYPFFCQQLDALNIPYTYEVFDGEHFDKMFERLQISLEFCSNKMHL